MLRRFFPLLFLALVSLPIGAAATTVRLVNLNEMSRQSAFIFHGTVAAVETLNLGTEDRPRIVTDVTFSVHRVLKGTTKGPQFTLRLIGGTHAGITLKIPGSPTFKPGHEVVLFLEWTGENYAINGMRQGLYQVSRTADGEKVAQRSLEGLCIVRPDKMIEHRDEPESARPLSDLFDAVRTATEEVTR
jgi:hypothetical protein